MIMTSTSISVIYCGVFLAYTYLKLSLNASTDSSVISFCSTSAAKRLRGRQVDSSESTRG